MARAAGEKQQKQIKYIYIYLSVVLEARGAGLQNKVTLSRAQGPLQGPEKRSSGHHEGLEEPEFRRVSKPV